MATVSKNVFITGLDSFTGQYLKSYLEKLDYKVYGTTYKTCDISKKDNIKKALENKRIDYFINLAAISFSAHEREEDFYKVNTIGTINLLETILELELKPNKILLVSSATVYGNQNLELLDETLTPMPTNHYGASKYIMETLAKNYFKKLPIIITRPFNYTGVGQGENFLIPKIIKHYKQKKKTIELGNLDISREFNDVSYVCEIYTKLLEIKEHSKIVNICSNKPISLLEVINIMNKIAGYKIKIEVNQNYVRKNEIKTLAGSTKKLFSLIPKVEKTNLESLLKNMYES